MIDSTLPLPGLSPVSGKAVEVRFDGGRLSSDGGLLPFAEVETKLGVADRLAVCLNDPRAPERIEYSLAEMIRFRLLAILAGYDADSLRHDPVFKIALDRLPETDKALCSQPSISRLENLPSKAALYRMGAAMIDLYCDSFRQVPDRIVLDIDDTFDAVHGGQQLRLFNAHYDEYGFQPIHVFDVSGRLVTSVLRPAKRPSGKEILTLVKRLIGRIRERWPRVTILLRGDGHYACPEVMDWCDANGVDYLIGLPGTTTLNQHTEGLVAKTHKRFTEISAADPDLPASFKLRRFKEFRGGAKSWKRARRIVARVEAGSQGTDVRYVVTNLSRGKPRRLYEKLYCARGQAENFIKAHKAHLASDRTSCTTATANQFRLFLHGAAYWVLWRFRQSAPKRSPLAHGPVRHHPPAPAQTRRPGRREDAQDRHPFAHLLSRSTNLPPPRRTEPEPPDLTSRAACPAFPPFVPNRKPHSPRPAPAGPARRVQIPPCREIHEYSGATRPPS